MIGRALLVALLVSACGKVCFTPEALVDAGAVDAPDAPCPTPAVGCTPVTCDGRCFEVCNATSTWAEAQQLCASRGQCLATIDTAAVSACIEAALPAATWIGLVQSPTAATPAEAWRWSCGIIPASPVWAPMEPNDFDTTAVEDHEEECGFLATDGDAVDVHCDTRLAYACELP